MVRARDWEIRRVAPYRNVNVLFPGSSLFSLRPFTSASPRRSCRYSRIWRHETDSGLLPPRIDRAEPAGSDARTFGPRAQHSAYADGRRRCPSAIRASMVVQDGIPYPRSARARTPDAGRPGRAGASRRDTVHGEVSRLRPSGDIMTPHGGERDGLLPPTQCLSWRESDSPLPAHIPNPAATRLSL